MDFKVFPKLPRLHDEYMYISEKIDGTNAQVFVYEEEVTDGVDEQPYTSRRIKVASRNQYITPENDNYGFARWCKENENQLIQLPLGRHYGEWWGNGIQRKYGMKEKKFSLFNQSICAIKEIIPCIDFVPVLYEGAFNLDKIKEVMEELKQNGSAASPGFMEPEGVVIYLKRASIMFKCPFDTQHKGKIT